jgi:endonuclease III
MGRLILHGRYPCKARKPECWRCPIRDVCRFKEKIEDKSGR